MRPCSSPRSSAASPLRSPPSNQIYDSFGWEEEYTYIPLPSLLAEDAAEKERIKAERDLERQREELERDDLWRTITIHDEADRARRDALIRMNEEVTAEARKKKQQMIDGFLGDLVKQLRATVYEATTDILATMSKNQGKLHPRSVVQLRNLIEQVGQMNFFGDTETDAMIRRVRSIFDQRPEARNAADLQVTLRDVAIITRASLLDLGEQPRASRIIGDEDTTPAEIATARRRLNLDATPNGDPADHFTMELPARRRTGGNQPMNEELFRQLVKLGVYKRPALEIARRFPDDDMTHAVHHRLQGPRPRDRQYPDRRLASAKRHPAHRRRNHRQRFLRCLAAIHTRRRNAMDLTLPLNTHAHDQTAAASARRLAGLHDPRLPARQDQPVSHPVIQRQPRIEFAIRREDDTLIHSRRELSGPMN